MDQEETCSFATVILSLQICLQMVYQGPPEFHEETAFH